MPQVKPAWLTLVIFSFQSLWNREGLEFIFSEELKMFPTILKQVASSGVARAGAAAAARRHPDDPADCGLFALPVQCYRDHGQLGH